MIIYEFNNYNDIWVKFDNGYKVHTAWMAFRKGSVGNPYDKKFYNIGYLGEGKYKAKKNGKITHEYNTWRHLLKRCYDERVHEKYPTYKNCTMCEEWHCFQNFAKWHEQNYYEIEEEQMELDKDILVKGNKLYSPNTCVFVPKNINLLFVTKENKKTKNGLPIGVMFHKRDKKFVAYCCNGKAEQKFLGNFHTPEEAFNKYKNFKEKVIKQVAEEYKDKIPYKLYHAMITYQVEITD